MKKGWEPKIRRRRHSHAE